MVEKKLLNNKFQEMKEKILYDIIVVGTGPAAVSAAIYSVRKGLTVGMIGEKIGGQVLDTNQIENIIGISSISGFQYAKSLENHVKDYNIHFKEGYIVKEIKLHNKEKILITNDKKSYRAKAVILATGAKHRQLKIPGEAEFTGKGVHFCTTCDGPFYQDLKVVIVGGGNSGVEAAIDMSGIAKKVILIEFLPDLKADKVLQEKLYERKNVSVFTNTTIKEVKGNDFVESIVYMNRLTSEHYEMEVDGLFFEIGLSANTSIVEDLVEVNKNGEIVIDHNNMTTIEGIFAAGDCTNIKYKQIVIAVGEGAKAALGAFDYLVSTY